MDIEIIITVTFVVKNRACDSSEWVPIILAISWAEWSVARIVEDIGAFEVHCGDSRHLISCNGNGTREYLLLLLLLFRRIHGILIQGISDHRISY